MSRLFAFGLGFSAQALAERACRQRLADRRHRPRRRQDRPTRIARLRGRPVLRRGRERRASHGAPRHDAISCTRSRRGRTAIRCWRITATRSPTLSSLEWIGYLSTVGVYGDQEGRWVDETTAPKPNSARTEARVEAEQAWLEFGEDIGVPVQMFRLAGIYGPGRSVFDKLREGTARRIKKDGQVFSRIHVEDIASVLEASIARPRAGAIYNVADDEPAAPGEVVAYAAKLIGVEPPPEVDFAEADLTPMARSFYEGSRRIGNQRIKSELGVKLRYPTYREGLASLLSRR